MVCSVTIPQVVMVMQCTITMLLVMTGGQECPGGWTHYGARCYVLLHDPVTWYEAKTACDTVDGQLAEVEDADHNNHITSMLTTQRGEQSCVGLGYADWVQVVIHNRRYCCHGLC